jgi:arsenite-transporting ATPase
VTAFFFVTLPLTLPISVVKRFIAQVQAYDIPVGGVIVNSCIRSDEAQKALADEYLQNKFHEQLTYLKVIETDLGPLVRSYIPLYKDEVHGLPALQQVAADMFAPADAGLFNTAAVV